MTSARTVFDPKRHGFQFANSFRIELKQELPLIGEVDLDDIVIGLCGGMCFFTLDHFHAGIPVTTRQTVPGTGSSLRNELIKYQVLSLIPPDGILKILLWTVKEDDYVWRHTAGREFGKLRTRLNKGQPAVLALIRVGSGGDPTKNHQVVAYSYDYDEQSGRARIGIYDPNLPGERSNIQLNVASPRTGIDIIQPGEDPLRGFFVIDYKPGKIDT